jgi:Pentapeptide repeats (8 copies)
MADKTEHLGAPAAPDATGDAGPTPAPGEPPQLPITAAALAGKAKDLQALRDAVVDAASVGAGLWFSYLFVLFYLLIAVGGVTHRDLFFQSPVKLPFLNVDLPLLGFFVLGPAIFLIVHAYVLLHFVLFAGKVGDFDAELRAQITDEEVQRRLRRQLPSNIFVQFLAGSREMRSGVMGFLLRLIAQISLVIGPIALLVFFELQFLPFHDEKITWWHRIAIAANIVLLWMLWPSIARGETARLSWRDFLRFKVLALAFASLAPVLLVTAIATFPGEWLDNTLPSVRIIPWKVGNVAPWHLVSLQELVVSRDVTSLRKLVSLREFLVAGEVDFASRKPESLWSNRLVLPGFDAIDHAKFDSEAKIEAASETISLRARHLEGAVLIGAKLRKADFTAAQLQGAQLNLADLRGAKFECGDALRPHPQQCAQLQGALLAGAQLQAASLKDAQLQGADLYSAQLQGADLYSAQLQSAHLEGAQLQSARLDVAQLQGAGLNYAQLQGATLDNSQLQGASFRNVFAWRTDARKAAWEDTRVVNPETVAKYGCWKVAEWSVCDWTPQSFNELKEMIAKQVPDGAMRRDAMTRIEESLDPDLTNAPEGESEMAKVWKAQARSYHATETYEKHLATIWQKAGCDAGGAPYVIRGLLQQLETGVFTFVAPESPQPRELAKAYLDAEHCPGALGLSDDEKARLKEIRDRSPPPAASKQQ